MGDLKCLLCDRAVTDDTNHRCYARGVVEDLKEQLEARDALITSLKAALLFAVERFEDAKLLTVPQHITIMHLLKEKLLLTPEQALKESRP